MLTDQMFLVCVFSPIILGVVAVITSLIIDSIESN